MERIEKTKKTSKKKKWKKIEKPSGSSRGGAARRRRLRPTGPSRSPLDSAQRARDGCLGFRGNDGACCVESRPFSVLEGRWNSRYVTNRILETSSEFTRRARIATCGQGGAAAQRPLFAVGETRRAHPRRRRRAARFEGERRVLREKSGSHLFLREGLEAKKTK